MRLAIGTLILLFSLISCSKEHYTIIRDVNVFDGEKIIENVDFVFSENGIKHISTKRMNYRKSTIINGEGKTIIPPLINAHVHVRNENNLKEALKVGIFGMLDMFSTDVLANRLRGYNDSLEYSKFYSSNVGATAPGGHGTQFGIAIPTINDTLSPKEFVAERFLQGADYIKITHEALMSRLSRGQLEEVIAEIHKYNKIGIAHVSDLENGLEVINKGIDGLAHIWYRNESIAEESDLELMRKKGVFVIPTLSVIVKLIDHSKQIGLEGKFLTMTELKEEVIKMHNSGICILAGTDSPNFNMDYSSQYFEELKLLKECGLTEIEALKSATINIYKQFKLEGFSKLEENSNSNFVLITGKPYERIEDMLNAKRIWKNGIEIN